MRAETTPRSWRRTLAYAAVAALGAVSIVGSGGGIGFAPMDLNVGPISLAPMVSVRPARTTVQAGTIVQFEAIVFTGDPPYRYQWRRDGVDIAGATGSTYTLGGAGLGDDGAYFHVLVTAANGTATSTAILRVSPLPGVVYEDTEFPVANWSLVAIAQPAQNGPRHTESQILSGGHPGAYRNVVYEMTPGPSSMRIFQFPPAATYDPAAQGTIYTLDLAKDCVRSGIHEPLANETANAWPMFEQSGRTYVPRGWGAACAYGWVAQRASSRLADEFELLAGPPCAAGEQCPDFSAAAAPLRFRFVTDVTLSAASPGGTLTQGIDNWKVTVWRR